MSGQDTPASPKIIVTGPDKRLRFAWWATRWITRAVGLNPSYVSTKRDSRRENIQGIVVGGGSDIGPELYGMKPINARRYDLERDRLELKLIERALLSDIPILGICRGAQLLNVVLGGTLFADIRKYRHHTPNKWSIFPVKSVKVETESRLAKALGQQEFPVNSLHNQAVDKLGSDLKLVAQDEDGIVQAIEIPERRYVVGVQWHPEYLPYHAVQRRLFQSFSDAVHQGGSTLAV